MTAIVRRIALSSLALGTLALAACAGDPVSPKAAGSASSQEIFLGGTTRTSTDSTKTP